MKITLEPYSGGIYTASVDAEHVSEVVNMFKGLLVQVGYHPKTVDEYFHDEESWFSEVTNSSCGVEEQTTPSDGLRWPEEFENKHEGRHPT